GRDEMLAVVESRHELRGLCKSGLDHVRVRNPDRLEVDAIAATNNEGRCERVSESDSRHEVFAVRFPKGIRLSVHSGESESAAHAELIDGNLRNWIGGVGGPGGGLDRTGGSEVESFDAAIEPLLHRSRQFVP